MKLGNLKSMIRSTKGSPVLQIELSPGTAVTVALMKGPLLVALDEAFPGGKATETSMTLETKGDDAVLRPEAGGVYAIKAATPGPLLAIMETPTLTPPAFLLDLDDDVTVAAAPTTTILLDL